MGTQPWNKAKLADWKRFWDSEMGQEAIARMKGQKERYLESAMKAVSCDEITALVNMAKGVDDALSDIFQGISAAPNDEKGGRKG